MKESNVRRPREKNPLTQCSLSVDILSVDEKSRVLINETFGFLVELFQRLFRPPRAHVSIGIVLSSVIVEAMRQFMTDDLCLE